MHEARIKYWDGNTGCDWIADRIRGCWVYACREWGECRWFDTASGKAPEPLRARVRNFGNL